MEVEGLNFIRQLPSLRKSPQCLFTAPPRSATRRYRTTNSPASTSTLIQGCKIQPKWKFTCLSTTFHAVSRAKCPRVFWASISMQFTTRPSSSTAANTSTMAASSPSFPGHLTLESRSRSSCSGSTELPMDVVEEFLDSLRPIFTLEVSDVSDESVKRR